MAKKDELNLQNLMQVIMSATGQQAPRNPQEELQALTQQPQQGMAQQPQAQQDPQSPVLPQQAQQGVAQGVQPNQHYPPAVDTPPVDIDPNATPWVGTNYYDDQGQLIPGKWNAAQFGGVGGSPTDPYSQYAIKPYMDDGTINPQWLAAGGSSATGWNGPDPFAQALAAGNWEYMTGHGFTDGWRIAPGAGVGQWEEPADWYDDTFSLAPPPLDEPVGSPSGASASNPGWGTATAGKFQAQSRMFAEPLSAYINQTIRAGAELDKTKEEGFQKRLGEMGLQGITDDDPYGSGAIAAQVHGELAKQAQAAGLKTGEYDAATGTFSGGTLDAETQAAMKLEAEKRIATLGTGAYKDMGEIGAKGAEERLSMAEKSRLSQLNMAEHSRLLGLRSKEQIANLSAVQSPFARMFGLGGEQAQGGSALPGLAGEQGQGNTMNNMFAMAGQGQRQNTAHKLLQGGAHGGAYNPFAQSTAAAPGMAGGQGSLLGLQGGMNAQQSAQLGANQQMGQLAMKAGQGLYGQFNPQLANMYSMQRPFAQAAGAGVGAMGQAVGGALAASGNIGAAG